MHSSRREKKKRHTNIPGKRRREPTFRRRIRARADVRVLALVQVNEVRERHLTCGALVLFKGFQLVNELLQLLVGSRRISSKDAEVAGPWLGLARKGSVSPDPAESGLDHAVAPSAAAQEALNHTDAGEVACELEPKSSPDSSCPSIVRLDQDLGQLEELFNHVDVVRQHGLRASMIVFHHHPQPKQAQSEARLRIQRVQDASAYTEETDVFADVQHRAEFDGVNDWSVLVLRSWHVSWAMSASCMRRL
eukprot:6201571-Pleurochrysis_carterae.AAC.8